MRVTVRRKELPPETVRSAQEIHLKPDTLRIISVKTVIVATIHPPYTTVISEAPNGELKIVVTEDGYQDNQRPKVGRK